MNYLVIDLEMCKVPKMYRNSGYKYASEIIQIGAVLLDQDYRKTAEISRYVHPDHGVLDHYIGELTGIQNKELKNAPGLAEVLKDIVDRLEGCAYKIYAWSENDFLQLGREIRCKQIEDERIGKFMDQERWIDYQKVFMERYEFTREIGLDEALMLCDIEPDGKFHNGLDDAVNTAKIIEKLEKDPEYKVHNYERETAKPTEHLKVSMGDLFEKLGFPCTA